MLEMRVNHGLISPGMFSLQASFACLLSETVRNPPIFWGDKEGEGKRAYGTRKGPQGALALEGW